MTDRIRRLFSSRGVFILLALSVMIVAPGYGRTFSFAVIADPHIDGSSDHNAKLKTAVDWIIGNKDGENIELVFVVGDIGWGGPRAHRNLKQAKGMLDRLGSAGIAYVPVIGDNEIQGGCDREFAETFHVQYRRLAKTLPGWRKAPIPVNGKYLQNFSFNYKGCHFICSDFNSRKRGNEGGELHDFAGGSWPWFENDIKACLKEKKESIVIVTHIGMFRTGFGKADDFLFSKDEMKKVKGFLWDYRDYVDSNYAGHIHQNWHASVWSGLFATIYHVRATDETWYCRQWPEAADRSITVRVVEVDSDGARVSYKQHVRNAREP
ncbi:MAG: metallophosphoesterase [Planctomycetota bacterium]|nr:metallophosphoesterase [Planctomycetota bacterium]